MDSEKCDVFLKILEKGSLTAAAEELGYTLSGVSRIVASMEKEAGLSLLIRNREGAALTREGEALLPAIRELSFWGQRFVQQARSIRGIEEGSIRVGSVYSVFYPWLAGMIADFSALHPGIRIEITEGTSSRMAREIEDRKADFCVISRREGSFRFVPLIRDEAMAILPKRHPAAGRGAFSMTRFQEEPFISLYPNQESDTSMLLKRHGITPNVRFTTDDLQAGYAMIEAGLGVSLENGVIARGLEDRLAVCPLDPPEFIDIGIAFPAKDVISPAAEAFAEYALARKEIWAGRQ